MDANGQRFWMLADDAQWHRWGNPSHVHYDAERRSLRLASERADVEWPDRQTEALSRLEQVPQTLDQFGTRARWNPGTGAVVASGALVGDTPIFVPATGEVPGDLALGYDGILYVALGGRVVLVDRRNRWAPFVVESAGFVAWRLAPDPGGGVWVLDRVHGSLARVMGQPLPERPWAVPAPSTFRPCEENPDPPRLNVEAAAVIPAGEMVVAIACSPGGRVAVLTWTADGDARVRRLASAGDYAAPVTLAGARHPFSVAWISDSEIAVLLASVNEAPAYDLGLAADETLATSAPPLGDLYPLHDHDGGPFVHRPALPPHYALASSTAPLHRLSLPSFARFGEASNRAVIDSESTQTVWHRIYLEASIPPHAAIRVWLAATNEAGAPIAESAWHEHRFGHGAAVADGAAVAQGAWVSAPSELPFHPGLLQCEPVKNRTGLFTALVQRPDRRVRSLRGRFLWIHVELTGDGRSSPEIAALRVYGSRFSYVNQYLPELYRESVFGPDAEQRGPATGPDFLERTLDNFESVLTPLEDRIANAYLLTDARTAPDDALEWLGSWIGVGFDPVYPPERRRQLLRSAPELYKWRGTARGLASALDVSTGGGVSGGEIVVLEDFRLRRTVATILGADLADEEDPLLAGLVASGNSYVGDTLFLGDESRKEFLALFAPDAVRNAAEQAAIDALFDGLAYRVTVLVHQEVEPQDLGLIRRVVELETPAHVLVRVVTATQPFVVGMAALVGVDTYLAPALARRRVEVGRSRVGVRDVLERLPSLDPRLEGPWPAADPTEGPTALLDAPATVESGDSFTLDGRRSSAGPGRRINRYRWRMLQ
jgi:phage tail-like protein